MPQRSNFKEGVLPILQMPEEVKTNKKAGEPFLEDLVNTKYHKQYYNFLVNVFTNSYASTSQD